MTILTLFSKYGDRKTQIYYFLKKKQYFQQGAKFCQKRKNIDPMLAMKLNFQDLQINMFVNIYDQELIDII